MSVTLGAYTFGCGNFHGTADVQYAPVKRRRINVFGLNGEGEIYGGRNTRQIPVRCTYKDFTSRGALNITLGQDDGQKTDRGLYTLNVDGAVFTDVIFNGLRAGRIFRNGANGLWVALDCTLMFESKLA